ncbi:hypothetical protein [Streptomyces sp. NPDC102437]|uniref:hypothetical protein n=1 Tax=Streptomyces sp. NPDC102437 TaxID=3366175 RepID=UPI0037F3F5C4
MSDQPTSRTTKFNEAEARRGLIGLVQKIANERFPDPVIKKGTVAMFSGLLALYGDAVQKTATEAQAGQAEARIAELEQKLAGAELHAARFHAAWHSARLRAQREASHSRVSRISRDGWRRRAKRTETAIDRVRALHQPTQGLGFGCDEDPRSYGDIAQACTSCGKADEYGVRWPCPTIRALDEQPTT